MLLKKQYLEEIEKETAWQPEGVPEMMTEELIATLPAPVQRHFKICGYLNKPVYNHVEIIWGDVDFYRAPGTGPLKLKCLQHNFAAEPSRIVYMSTFLGGFIPFEGRDKLQDGKGNMLMKIGKFFTMQDVKSDTMDKSALVTTLAEMFVLPAYAFRPYIGWKEIDNHSAGARISWNGISMEGVFHFNEAGEFVRFDTDERYMSNPKGDECHPWSAYCGDYIEKNGYRIPSFMSAKWHLPTGDMEYFRGEILGFRY